MGAINFFPSIKGRILSLSLVTSWHSVYDIILTLHALFLILQVSLPSYKFPTPKNRRRLSGSYPQRFIFNRHHLGMGLTKHISDKQILKNCSPYIFLVFFSVAPFNKRFSGPKDLNETWTQLIQTASIPISINPGDVIGPNTHLSPGGWECVFALMSYASSPGWAARSFRVKLVEGTAPRRRKHGTDVASNTQRWRDAERERKGWGGRHSKREKEKVTNEKTGKVAGKVGKTHGHIYKRANPPLGPSRGTWRGNSLWAWL